eukprot:CAMPEP_0176441142 /NCGR_PEP_ID=MMETSP0127-20121128/21020_1 /TAXON_ID=938130 /ORGANISM="Platyophrya macrostoma, Strain WH" /LENGTH=385 /DNA_ID=CAMNT_0017825861 /DNA_START=24 /DNA_END=1181 /DNA_ORIENTATION=-
MTQPAVGNNSHAAAFRMSMEILRVGSYVVLGGYAMSLAYRFGIVKKLLPPSINKKLEEKVDAIKARTEPPSGSALFNVARGHLLKTYGWASAGVILGCAGSGAFFKFPAIPIGLTLVATITPALALQFIPKRFISDAGRKALFVTSSVACGYSLGPMNWICYDSLIPVGILVGSTVAGFAVPLFLTRGMVSYFFSTQLLSSSLAVAAASLLSPPQSTATTTSQRLSSTSLIVNDANVALVIQMIANATLALLHTIPTIRKCVTWKESTEKLSEDLDPLMEGFHISASIAYATWSAFRVICSRILLSITKDDYSKGATPQAEQRMLRSFLNMAFDVDKWSRICASIMFTAAYVRVVSQLQRSGSMQHLEHWRLIFAKFSPVQLARV